MGWDAFEPVLSRAEEMDAHTIWQCAADVPEEWYEGDRDGLDRLVQALHQRRGTIRKLIGEFRKSTRNPFSSWSDSSGSVALSTFGQDEVFDIR